MAAEKINPNDYLFMKEHTLSSLRKYLAEYVDSDLLVNYQMAADKKGLPNLLLSCYRAVERMDKEKILVNPLYKDEGQIFTRAQMLKSGPIHFSWSISVMSSLLERGDISLQEFKVSELMPYVSTDMLKSKIMADPQINPDPIYVIQYIYQDQQWAVDGNHRVAKLHRQNPSNIVAGYLFPSRIHMEAIVLNFMQVAYAIVYNVNAAVDYSFEAGEKGEFPETLPQLLHMDGFSKKGVGLFAR